MVDSLRERAWTFICATFPERQVYIRSDGRVQFFTFGPMMQAILAGITLVFLTWVAFTSVNTIFKDRIIASKEQNFRQMQGSYETRIANLQLSYDELNGALVSTEDHFRSVVSDVEARHRMLADLIRTKENLRQELGLDAEPTLVPNDQSVEDELDLTIAPNLEMPGSPPSADAAAPAPEGAAPQLEIERTAPSQLGIGGPTQGFLEGAVRRIGRLFGGEQHAVEVDHPSLRQIAQLESELTRLLPIQVELLNELKNEIDRDTGRFEETLEIAGIRKDTILSRMAADNAENGGIGGPEIALSPAVLGRGDPAFGALALDTATAFNDYVGLANALRVVPLGEPLETEEQWIASGFGARLDPFTKQLAFHGGIDFSGPRGTDVHVTAPGKVVFTGPRGAYGNAVEVDHGFGMKTRYGHLQKILVTVGSELSEGDVVGELGSTGRTTGPHLHYEVWYDDTLRNPSKFLRAGRYVHEEQGN